MLLQDAGVAVVPFQAFDLDEDSGWFRISIGTVTMDELTPMLARLEASIHNVIGK